MLDILLVDDEPSIRLTLGAALREQGHHLETASDAAEALSRLDLKSYGLVVSDVRLPNGDGFEILRKIVRESPSTEVVLMTAYGSIPDAITAIREKAIDYVTKPFAVEEMLALVDRIDERRALRAELKRTREELANMRLTGALTGRTPCIERLKEQIHAVSDSEASVLVTGESGTGKELVARMIHSLSSRRDRPFVAVNCGAVPSSLIEAELFGHERGAFTGAVRRREGRFAAANRGTLFLDEIGEMPLDAQVKLLRVLQEGTYEPVGADVTVKTDVRVISATNRDLRVQTASGAFRADLYYRVRVFEMNLAPLRERRGDLPLLVEQFLREFVPAGVPSPNLTPAAWAALAQHSFPGNVRELKHAIQHGVILARGDDIDEWHLPTEIRGAKGPRLPAAPHTLITMMERHEREYLMQALELASGERQRAAQILGISRKTLWKKLRKFGLGDSSSSNGSTVGREVA